MLAARANVVVPKTPAQLNKKLRLNTSSPHGAELLQILTLQQRN
jgi:hypothetical protein